MLSQNLPTYLRFRKLDEVEADALAWAGLEETATFQQICEDEPDFKQLIESVNDSENTNFEILAHGEKCD